MKLLFILTLLITGNMLSQNNYLPFATDKEVTNFLNSEFIGSMLVGQIHSKSWGEVDNLLGQQDVENYGFVIRDTLGNRILYDGKALAKFFLFEKIENKKIKSAPLKSSPILQVYDDEIFNIDTVLNHSLIKIADYNIYNEIKSLISDSAGINLSDYETVDYNLYESLSYLIKQKHNGIDYYRGLTFSDVVYYGDYGFQLVKIYYLNKDRSRPIYWKLVVLKTKRRVKLIEIISSEPMN